MKRIESQECKRERERERERECKKEREQNPSTFSIFFNLMINNRERRFTIIFFGAMNFFELLQLV